MSEEDSTLREPSQGLCEQLAALTWVEGGKFQIGLSLAAARDPDRMQVLADELVAEQPQGVCSRPG